MNTGVKLAVMRQSRHDRRDNKSKAGDAFDLIREPVHTMAHFKENREILGKSGSECNVICPAQIRWLEGQAERQHLYSV